MHPEVAVDVSSRYRHSYLSNCVCLLLEPTRDALRRLDMVPILRYRVVAREEATIHMACPEAKSCESSVQLGFAAV